ncbi:hypothetical protein Ga0123462_0658 [Mariprofundus ferrinatatus]|uniref:Uncharacterized protein n=1 Tax=Mariprofundus ferrinatatus TaxID=1921087 RepID=A0A2K8L2I2_9PROT|nr:hypothetical protein Ga0123462_0658 [Mariprofundus ferrinatatus]
MAKWFERLQILVGLLIIVALMVVMELVSA